MFGNEEEAPGHDAAQICLNGHVINDAVHWSPELNQKFCSRCGEATTTSCPQCGVEIRGRYYSGPVVHGSEFPALPSYCANCGHSYPWTERRLKAAKELADEFEELNEGERDKLKGALDDLVKDSAQTEVAGTRFKKIVSKLGKESAGAIKNILTDVLSETAKKVLLQ